MYPRIQIPNTRKMMLRTMQPVQIAHHFSGLLPRSTNSVCERLLKPMEVIDLNRVGVP